MYLTANPSEHKRWYESQIGLGRIEMLMDLKRDTALGKKYRQTQGKGELSRHYRDELKKMIEARNNGEREVNFEAWQ